MLNSLWWDMLLRRYLLTSVDGVPFSPVWIGVCSILVTGAILAFPNRFCDPVDCARHPALGHPAAVRCHCTARHLTVRPRATSARMYRVVKHTLEWEVHAGEWVIKEAAPTLAMRIMAAFSTPRIREEWVGHRVS